MNGLINTLSSILEEFLGTRTEDFKKRVVAGLSFGFSRTLAVLIMALLAVVVLFAILFRDDVMPMLQKILYTEEELQIMQKWAAQ